MERVIFYNAKLSNTPSMKVVNSRGVDFYVEVYDDGKNVLMKTNYDNNFDGVLVIPDGITDIAQDAFANNQKIKYVVMPYTINTICNYAFTECKNLIGVTLPPKMSYIGDGAFSGCESLTTFNLPIVGQIGNFVFRDCINLKYLSVREAQKFNMKSIEKSDIEYIVFENGLVQDLSEFNDIPMGVNVIMCY